eukprot:CAMPEP_0185842362 /NCGR_PEP_ID=MMETSP1353-20130828/18368_1 /TAXON_ID=1077150 /ORGANISM="Erythrolobus australicus, Strain CCMP3124" /LENGTH=84 /DNA_ID=CAMNT_0028541863 /DNA_START=703 /DNA_END=957 /DNA_ORIENTATION=-
MNNTAAITFADMKSKVVPQQVQWRLIPRAAPGTHVVIRPSLFGVFAGSLPVVSQLVHARLVLPQVVVGSAREAAALRAQKRGHG